MDLGLDFWLELFVLLACLFYAAPRGGFTLGMIGGVGLIHLHLFLPHEARQTAGRRDSHDFGCGVCLGDTTGMRRFGLLTADCRKAPA